MFVVGLTGGIGSGKSTVARQFAELGVELVDADLLAREVVQPGSKALAQIADHFGVDFIDDQGALRRARLRQRVFADPAAKRWLEALLHPLINALLEERIARCQSPYCLLVSPLLFETGQHRLTDRVLVVDVSETTQLARALQRDGGDAATIERIIASQSGRSERRQRADDILDNERSPALVAQDVTALHSNYLQLAKR